MGVLVHAVQGRALLRGAVIREQGVRVAVQRMAGVTFHHDARLPRQAELCHQGVQIGGLVVDVGGQQHLAALVQVVLQHGRLVHQSVIRRKIRRGCVDDQQAAVLRDLAGQQIQRLQGDVLGVQRLGEGAGQGLFPMVRGIVGHPGVAAGEFIDGGCDLLLAAKGHIGTAGGVIVGVVILVQIGGIQHHAVLPAGHDQASGGCIFGPVLRRKGGVKGRVLLLPMDMAAFGGVMVQQLRDDGIFAARLTQIINGHIPLQALCQLH